MGGKKRGIPDRWLNYSKTGVQIEGTQFVAFKVPLKPELTVSETDEVKFDPSELVERLPDLGLVVDLTNTDRYYNPTELKKFNIRYCKIATKGHEIPENRLVQQFFRVVTDFLRNKPEKLIGVHCTHGVNRTGYFICSYMVLIDSLPANDAINKFDVARGHKQERENYLTALRLLNHTANRRIETNYPRVTHIREFQRREYFPLQRSISPRANSRTQYENQPVPEFRRRNYYYENHRDSRRNEYQYSNSRTRPWMRRHDLNQTGNGRYGGSSFY